MTIKKTYFCDVCKGKIERSFPGMKLYWNNAVPHLGRKTLDLKHVCYVCTHTINKEMEKIYFKIKEAGKE